jgi:hypothetical protein
VQLAHWHKLIFQVNAEGLKMLHSLLQFLLYLHVACIISLH